MQIDYLTQSSNKFVVESLSIEWAISILGYIDSLYSKSNLKEFYRSERWLNFENELKVLPFYDAIKQNFESAYYGEEIKELMNRINLREENKEN